MKVNSPEESDILVQKLPSDMGIHRNPRKGTLKAPETILEDFSFENKILIDEVFPDEFNLKRTHRRIEENTQDLIEYGRPLLSIGGDHSVSFPVIKALKQDYPDLQIVWLDSHLDLKQKIDDHVSHDVVVRELLENRFSEDEIWFVGVTKIDNDEKEFLDDRDVRVFKADELQDFLREFNSSEQPVYLSIDIDVLTQELAPGTGYPDGELSLDEAKKAIETVKPDHADLVEVAPPFDKEEKTVENARKLLETLKRNLV